MGATPEGIFDLAGNVWEWCLDFYDTNYYAECKQKGVVKNPRGPETGNFRIDRGSSWYSGDAALRGARRSWNYPDGWNVDSGFRVCVAGES